MSVLAHLAASRGEPGATQALAYVLNQQPGIVRAFVNLLSASGLTFEPRHPIESERGDDGGRIPGRPDMKIYDTDGNPRVLVENKFWAGLTDAQPTGYLRMLQDDVNTALLFIVPRQGFDMYWKELKRRCQEEEFVLGNEDSSGRIRWVQVGHPPEETKTMLITDWRNVLDTLEGAADGQEIRGDILQLRRLAETLENLQAFPALRSDEVTNADMARRINNYIQLIVEICTKFQEMGMTYASNQASFYGPYFYGRVDYDNSQGGRDSAYLTLSFHAWRESGGITPLWLWVNQAVQLFRDVDVHRFDTHHGAAPSDKFIPIRLKLGVERERVIEDAVEQIRATVFGG